MTDFFFDSYAMIEILLKNPNYEKYKEENFIFGQMNLAEIGYSFLLKNEEKVVKFIFENLQEYVVDISNDIILKAIKFRLKNKKLNLSYIDCIGYIYACENNLKFLTGDEKFKNMKNVEFVKK